MSAEAQVPQWAGELWMAPDFVLLHGSAGTTSMHAHYAHQLLLSPASTVTVELEGETISRHRLLIESMREHSIITAPASMFTVFAEPVTIAAEMLRSDVDTRAPTLESLAEIMRRLARRPAADPRVGDALAGIDLLLAGKVGAGELAKRVDLSLSQLERLFSAELGLPIRRMVRWRRLRLALALALQGQPLTAAARQAGFADSAHLSRTMRAMFGVRADRILPGMRLKLID
ncbi:MAG: AraC family transcriptional regulator [Hydrocarboniphaga sp.]|uniref:helix-turn-helix domain-containing protein n=1 Tax=Hydrocarboniphaga sp. TaxID=2033016 RepID=UPI002631126F|nr:AraC family transcriptional regulator [Hydrocarboniphaga sp.]MDB5971225.1 AraC family transcriptional regulator [Hydrocarboniphaga sp.]